MTELIKCDNCGKEFKSFFSTTIETYTYVELLGHIMNPKQHLCDDCTKLLEEWLIQ